MTGLPYIIETALLLLVAFAAGVGMLVSALYVPFRDVPALLTVERILEVIELTAEGLAALRGRAPQIAVCGLNPHASEHGLFGDEEIHDPGTRLTTGPHDSCGQLPVTLRHSVIDGERIESALEPAQSAKPLRAVWWAPSITFSYMMMVMGGMLRIGFPPVTSG
jgi:hypothetical protein